MKSKKEKWYAVYCCTAVTDPRNYHVIIQQKENGINEIVKRFGEQARNRIKFYEDQGGISRNDFLVLQKDVKSGIIKAIVTETVSKISRNTFEFLMFMDFIKKYNTELIVLDNSSIDKIKESKCRSMIKSIEKNFETVESSVRKDRQEFIRKSKSGNLSKETLK